MTTMTTSPENLKEEEGESNPSKKQKNKAIISLPCRRSTRIQVSLIYYLI